MKKFLELVADIMEVEVEQISLDTEYQGFAKWDSLMMLNLVMEIEAEYDISIPLEKINTIKNLRNLFDLTN